jgi:flagellar biosynthesis protein FlhA
VVINFVVVTKGAERIAEVSARFALDAMPGKQMAVDADLNAGTDRREGSQAPACRSGEEADFFGSMDGASKFVRGDAVAGILILLINICRRLRDRRAAAWPDRRAGRRHLHPAGRG